MYQMFLPYLKEIEEIFNSSIYLFYQLFESLKIQISRNLYSIF
jgi:hypothetical protein